MTDTALHVENLRGYPQGEIFLLNRVGEAFDALVYNTTGFGPCPADEFAAIDIRQLAAAGPSALPGGWAYQTRALDRDLTITTDGLAHIFSDNLANMYQGCVDRVANFDPWVWRVSRWRGAPR